MPTAQLAIIGGGASAAALTIHLARHLRHPVHIHVFDPALSPWRGVAYGRAAPWHLLNVRGKGMSILPEEPDHFVHWLKNNGEPADPEGFAPRVIYGNYLTALATGAAAIIRQQGGEVSHHRLAIVGLRRQDEGWVLQDEEGEEHSVTHAVLASGNPSPRPIAAQVQHSAIIQNPWFPASDSLLAQADLSETTKADDRIILVGTGLTMVDIAISLMQRGYRGSLTAVSRHAHLPRPHKEGITPIPCALSQHPEQAPRTAASLLHALRQEAKEAVRHGHDWRCIVDGIRPVTVQLWQQLPEKEKQRIARRLGSTWSIHRHRMAVAIYQQLQEWIEYGRLALHEGAAQRVELHEKGAALHLRNGEILPARAVINCTGPDLSTATQPLLKHLTENGLARPGALGWGVATNDAAQVLGPAETRLYAIGPLRAGDRFESTAMPEIRMQAKALAETLAAVL
ncbi:hypothetical protein GC177_02630 [bacterium]|nr:hypothetical protein [bacterium]